MGILGGISKERQRLRRRYRELEREPRPHGLAEAARGFLALGDGEMAERALSFGESRFPDSEELRRVRTLQRLHRAEADLRAAKERVRTAQSAAAWLELADCHRRVGRVDRCAAALRQLLDRFGEHGTALAQLGEIRFQRWRESRAAADGLAAMRLLERAAAADAEALKPRLLLAGLFHMIGAKGLASRWLDELLRIAPGHERAVRLKDAPGAGRAGPVAGLMAAAEERGAFAADLPWDEKARGGAARAEGPRSDRVEVELDRVRSEAGGARATLVVAGQASPADLLAREATALGAFAARAARGMDLGPVSGLRVEGEDGAVVIEMKRDATLAVALPRDAAVEPAAVSARDALERIAWSP